MSETYKLTQMRVIHEQGIRFAVGRFLCGLPPSLEQDFYDKTVEFFIQSYYEEKNNA